MKAYENMGMKIYINELGHMTKMAATPYMVIPLNNLLQNHSTECLETSYVALSAQLLQRLVNDDLGLTFLQLDQM